MTAIKERIDLALALAVGHGVVLKGWALQTDDFRDLGRSLGFHPTIVSNAVSLGNYVGYPVERLPISQAESYAHGEFRGVKIRIALLDIPSIEPYGSLFSERPLGKR